MKQSPNDIPIANEREFSVYRLLKTNWAFGSVCAGGPDEQQLLFSEGGRCQTPPVINFIRESEIQLTALQGVNKNKAQFFDHAQRYSRKVLLGRHQNFGSDQCLNAGRDAKINNFLFLLAVSQHIFACRFDRPQYDDSVLMQYPSRFSQRNTPRMTDQKRNAKGFFKKPDLLSKRRLSKIQFFGRPGYISRLDHFYEIAKLPEIDGFLPLRSKSLERYRMVRSND